MCLVDAEAIFADGDNQRLNILKLRQIGFADLVVLNKIDLVGPEHFGIFERPFGELGRGQSSD